VAAPDWLLASEPAEVRGRFSRIDLQARLVGYSEQWRLEREWQLWLDAVDVLVEADPDTGEKKTWPLRMDFELARGSWDDRQPAIILLGSASRSENAAVIPALEGLFVFPDLPAQLRKPALVALLIVFLFLALAILLQQFWWHEKLGRRFPVVLLVAVVVSSLLAVILLPKGHLCLKTAAFVQPLPRPDSRGVLHQFVAVRSLRTTTSSVRVCFPEGTLPKPVFCEQPDADSGSYTLIWGQQPQVIFADVPAGRSIFFHCKYPAGRFSYLMGSACYRRNAPVSLEVRSRLPVALENCFLYETKWVFSLGAILPGRMSFSAAQLRSGWRTYQMWNTQLERLLTGQSAARRLLHLALDWVQSTGEFALLIGWAEIPLQVPLGEGILQASVSKSIITGLVIRQRQPD
jgi:hypothetical protein